MPLHHPQHGVRRIVEPCEAVFEGVVPGLIYAQNISIRNVASVPRRFRIEPPSRSGPFELVFAPCKALAPGLDALAEVRFHLKEDLPLLDEEKRTGVFRDKLVVTFEGETPLDVPLVAREPHPNVIALTGCEDHGDGKYSVSLGDILAGTSKDATITLLNKGPVEASFSFKCSDDRVSFDPAEGTIAADVNAQAKLAEQSLCSTEEPPPRANGDSIMKVRIRFDATKQDGAAKILIAPDFNQPNPPVFDLFANVVNQKLEMFRDQTKSERLTSVDFNALFFGQSREQSAVLVNDSPEPTPFVISVVVDKNIAVQAVAQQRQSAIEDEGGEAAAADDEDIKFLKEWEIDDGAFTISPLEGLLEPYSSHPVTFRFAPRISPIVSAFKHKLLQAEDDNEGISSAPEQRLKRRRARSRLYGLRVGVAIPDGNNQISNEQERRRKSLLEVEVTGQAAPSTAIVASPRTLRFGTCEVRSKQKALLSIENTSDLAAKFEFARVAHFSVQPSRGKIHGNATKTVVVSYHPAQIGAFDIKCEFSVEGGLTTSFLRLVGKAIQMTTRNGTGLAEETTISSRFVDGKGRVVARPSIQDLLPGQSTALKSAEVGLSKDGSARFDSEQAHHLELLQERARRDMNRTQYIQYLRRRRAKRETLAAKRAEEERARVANRDRSDPTGVDLGLECLEEPPLLPLPDASHEPLWMEKSSRKSRSSGGATGLGDPDKLIKKKFKPRPATQSEMRHCETRLCAADLAHIVPNVTTLDFGRVCVASKVVKNFAVSNELSHAILVAMSASSLPSELSASANAVGVSQVVPAERTAGFDIVFECDRESPDYRSVVQFALNDRHQLKLNVTAEVVPVELVPSSPDVYIQFDPRSLEPSASTELSLRNPGNSDVEFVWITQAPFSITPARGTVSAYGELNTVVTWTPTPAFRNTCKLRLHVPGARKDLEIVATGKLDDSRCTFSEKQLNFGTLSIGTECETTIAIRSVGSGPAVCTLEIPSDASHFISLSTTNFIVSAGSSQDIHVTFKPLVPCNLEGTLLACHVRGTKTIRVPIVGDGIVPNIHVIDATYDVKSNGSTSVPTFDFGSQFVGFEERRIVALRNDSDISVELTLDMTSQPEFWFEPHESRLSHDSELGTKDGESTSKTNSVEENGANEEPVSQLELAGDADTLNVSLRGQAWLLRIAPKDTLLVNLIFAPRSPGLYEFKLPLELCESYKNEFGGRVQGTALPPMLVVSTTSIDFGERILVGDSSRQLPITEDIALLNQHHDTIKWEIDDDEGDSVLPKSFYVSPKAGSLAPGESATVRVTFAPHEARAYEQILPLIFSAHDKPSLTIHLRGTGAHPRLEIVDPSEDEGYARTAGDVFVFPTVPLGLTSRVRFDVRNRGFESIQLKHRLPPHIPVKIEVDFPNGRALSITTPQVTVILSFSSDSPVSFSSALQLLDSDGNIYIVPIAGTADNCILSTYAFVGAYSSDFIYHAREGAPPRLVDAALARQLIDNELREKEEQRMARRQSRGNANVESVEVENNHSGPPKDLSLVQMPGDDTRVDGGDLMKHDEKTGVDPQKPRPVPGDEIPSLLVLWLNYHALNSQNGAEEPMRVIPDDVVATHGRPAIDAIEALAGRKIPNRISQKSRYSDKELLAQLMIQYDALLLFMKERGA